MAAVVALLHSDVTFTGDSNRRAPTAARVIVGPDKVARFMLGLAQRYGPRFFTANQLVRINGDLGAYTAGSPARRRLSGDGPAYRRDDGQGREGLRGLGHRQSGQVHRFTASPDSRLAQGIRHASPELKPCSVMPSAVLIRARMFSTPIW